MIVEGIDNGSLGRLSALSFDLGPVKPVRPFLQLFSRPAASIEDYQVQVSNFPVPQPRTSMKQAVIQPDDRLFLFHFPDSLSHFPDNPKENMKTRTRRVLGYVVFVGESRSAGFWAVIKSRIDGRLHFAYGKSFLGSGVPKIGHEVEFTRLPPADRGDLDRAIEVAIIKCRKGGKIEGVHAEGATRLILRSGQASKAIRRAGVVGGSDVTAIREILWPTN
jgi:hypothetical protein